LALNDLILDLKASSDFNEIKRKLARANATAIDTSNSIVLDITNQSYIAKAQKLESKLLETKYIDKQDYLGVVLFVEKPSGSMPLPKIYVDIPGQEFERIDHPDPFNVLASNSPDILQAIDHKAFYPISEGLIQSDYPSPNDIVRVRVPKNYFNSQNTNPTDNLYLGIFLKNKYIYPSKETANNNKKSSDFLQLIKDKTSPPLQNKPPVNRNIEVFNKLKEKLSNFNLSDAKIAAFVGNFQQESNLKSDIENSIGAFGIGQWLGSRKEELKKFAILQGKPITDLDLQVDFIAHELNTTEKKVLKQLSKIPVGIDEKEEAAEAAYIIRRFYERPGESEARDDNRIQYSLDTLEAIQTQQKLQTEQEQPSMTARVSETSSTNSASNNSPPVNRPKMLLRDFTVDKANGIRTTANLGSGVIRVREDIVQDLAFIKDKLNQYNIALTCENQDIKINNNKISLLAKVGLEVRLNPYAGLSSENNLDIDDYFVGPDYSRPVGNGYKLIVYGNVRRNIKYFDEQYVPKQQIIDVYDPRNLNSNGPPSIKKIFKSVINITKIFEDRGFVAVLPKQEFFLYSDLEKSNWNIFQKASKIIVGYSYKELLSTVYYDNGESIWKTSDLKWDGNKFI
jgi:Phage tail lysozyme